MLASDDNEIIIPINFDHDVWKDKRRSKLEQEKRFQLARRSSKSKRRKQNDQDMEDSENE